MPLDPPRKLVAKATSYFSPKRLILDRALHNCSRWLMKQHGLLYIEEQIQDIHKRREIK